MKKALLIVLLALFIICPALVQAKPIDQYGRFVSDEGIENYISLSEAPNYFSGEISRPYLTSYLFYQPEINSSFLADKSIVITPLLSNNPEQDAALCSNAKVFSSGRYVESLVRIAPVCASDETIVKKDKAIKPANYYKEIIDNVSAPITKVFHVKDTDTRRIYTDRPEVVDLKYKIIQGETDSAMYYVDLYNGKEVLRKLLPEKAQSMWGQSYQDKILYFSDSIIYSYQRGYSLY